MSARGVRLFGLNYVSTRAALSQKIFYLSSLAIASRTQRAQERPKSISKNSASSKDVTISTLCVRMLKLCSRVSNNLFLFMRTRGIFKQIYLSSLLGKQRTFLQLRSGEKSKVRTVISREDYVAMILKSAEIL
jgi:hypothetical protein